MLILIETKFLAYFSSRKTPQCGSFSYFESLCRSVVSGFMSSTPLLPVCSLRPRADDISTGFNSICFRLNLHPADVARCWVHCSGMPQMKYYGVVVVIRELETAYLAASRYVSKTARQITRQQLTLCSFVCSPPPLPSITLCPESTSAPAAAAAARDQCQNH